MTNSDKHDSIDTSNSDDGEVCDCDERRDEGVNLRGGSEEDLVRGRGLTDRLTDLFVGRGDGDLLLGEKDGGVSIMQWIQALDMQMIGACRVDERIKPLLKSGGGGGGGDDRLLAHLSQYFEPSEVGLLAMCLCMPLVSMRVGKVLKQGSLLLPTEDRGDLNLVLLPTSDLRLSFNGDDGKTETLFTLSCNYECSIAVIEEIPADSSGRSFLVKCPDSSVYYFWCSEKSKLLGIEVLAKMKDLCERKPSLAELTGISESRLEYFATHLRGYFSGSTSGNDRPTSRNPSSQCLKSSGLYGRDTDLNSSMSKSMRSRISVNQALKSSSPCQSSLSPRPNLFKEGSGRNFLSLKNVAREKLRRRAGDNTLSVLDNITTDTAVISHKYSDESSEVKHFEVPRLSALSAKQSSFQSLDIAPPSFCSLTADLSSKAFCSPAYCWCPIGSAFPITTGLCQLPLSTTNLRTLPPLASLLARTSSVQTPLPHSPQYSSLPFLELPSFIPDAVGRLPFSMPSSFQISTLTSIICDPIVHIPVIDICSSGHSYLVSAASGTTLPPFNSSFVSQMLPRENMVENGAKETLRRLMGNSDQASPPWIDMFSTDGDDKSSNLVGGSRGLYSGACDVDMIANSIAALGMISLSERSIDGDSYNSMAAQGNCELESINMDHPLNQTNPKSMDERQE